MVRLERFELSTSCFGGTRSIHLSYSRVLLFQWVASTTHTLIYIMRSSVRIPLVASNRGFQYMEIGNKDGVNPENQLLTGELCAVGFLVVMVKQTATSYSMRLAMMESPLTSTSIEIGGRRPPPRTI